MNPTQSFKNLFRLDSSLKRGWVLAILTTLIGYQALMYGFVMRVVLHLSVVLIPWLLHQPGYRLYDTINLGYTPGYLWFESAIAGVLPDPQLRIRLQMILFTAITTILIYYVARRWWGAKIGLLAAGLYAVWGPAIMDYLLYFEMFLGLLALCALAVWDNTAPSPVWRPLLAGLCLGMAIMVKQHGVALVIVFIVWRLTSSDRRAVLRDLFWMLTGVAIPLLIGLAIIAAQGLLGPASFLLIGSFGPYATAYEPPPLSEVIIFIIWAAPALLFGLLTVFRRESWGHVPILLIGLWFALLTPAFPRYGRFHLGGAIPIMALIGAGMVVYVFQIGKVRSVVYLVARGYTAVSLLFVLLALVLPTYYRLKLGPQTQQYTGLSDLVAQMKKAAPITSGQRAWMLPEIDPTSNFYAISGDLPPRYWAEEYPWLWQASPLIEAHMLQGLDADPPAIAIVIERWRDQIPAALNTYLSGHYTAIGQISVGYDIQSSATLYRKN